jgi:hypothetical protein
MWLVPFSGTLVPLDPSWNTRVGGASAITNFWGVLLSRRFLSQAVDERVREGPGELRRRTDCASFTLHPHSRRVIRLVHAGIMMPFSTTQCVTYSRKTKTKKVMDSEPVILKTLTLLLGPGLCHRRLKSLSSYFSVSLFHGGFFLFSFLAYHFPPRY